MLVHQLADEAFALGLIAVDKIERAARVVTRVFADFQTGRELRSELEIGLGQLPITITQRALRQRRAELFRKRTARSDLVRVEHIGGLPRRCKTLRDEAPDLAHRNHAVLLAERVVIEAGQSVELFERMCKPIVESTLRLFLHDKIRARRQHLRGHMDVLGTGDDAVRRLIQTEQHAHRNRACNLRVGVVSCGTFLVVREHAGLHIARDEEVATQLAHQRQARPCEWNVELDVERRRRHAQRTNSGRVVMHPSGGEHRAHALRHHRHVFGLNAELGLQMLLEAFDVVHAGRERRRIAARSGRLTVPARIPCVEIKVRQIEFFDQMLHAPRMLVPAMEQQNRLFLRTGRAGLPTLKKQLRAVVAHKPVLTVDSHPPSRGNIA